MNRESEDPDCVEQLLAGGWLKRVEWHEETTSTNLLAKEALQQEDELPLPCLWVANRQTEGRGRGENRWWSPEGCLMFSLAWSEPFGLPQERIPQLALVVGLSLSKAIERFTEVACQIKWPNDLYLQHQKIAGILVESCGRNRWIIGVGLNVQVATQSAATEELRQRATSLHYWCHRIPSREQVLIEVIDSIRNELERWPSHPDYLPQEWFQRCYLTDKRVRIDSPAGALVGRCLGIDTFGRLQIETDDGAIRTIIAGTVRLEEARG